MIMSTTLKRKNKLIKSLTKKILSENPTKDDVKELNELINKEEMDINRKLFQTFFGF